MFECFFVQVKNWISKSNNDEDDKVKLIDKNKVEIQKAKTTNAQDTIKKFCDQTKWTDENYLDSRAKLYCNFYQAQG